MEKIISLVVVLLGLCAVNSDAQEANKADLNKSEQFADSLIQTLSLQEKVSLLSGMGTSGGEFGDRDVPYFGIKGIPGKGIPDFIMGHGITGVRTGRDRKVHATYFGAPIGYASTWNVNLYAKAGEALAKEMRALGQDLNLGPTINIIRHPQGGRNWECLSEDPYLTGQFIVPFVKAMQSNGIVCGPKHFVANNQDHNRFDINNVLDERTLREIYLPAFQAAVQEGGAMNMMASYNRLNGVFMCQNKRLLNDILRDEWRFNGFVLSDFGNGLRSTLAGVYSGLNVEMAGPKFYGENLVKTVNEGSVSEKQIDALLFDVIKTMHWIGVFDRPRYENKEVVHSKENIAIAAQVARESPVLLKNEGKILPLKKEVKSIAVIGPNAKRFESLTLDMEAYAYYLQGGGSGRCYYFPESVIDPYTGIQNNLSEKTRILYAVGCQTPDLSGKMQSGNMKDDDDQLIKEAVRIAKQAESVVVFAGKCGSNESEGWDQQSTFLPGKQDKLIGEVLKANENTVIVVIAGSYVNMSKWVDQAKAVLFVPYCGEQIGNGIAEILFGDVSPSGKLSVSWPRKVEDYPDGSILTGPGYSKNGESNVYSEGIFVGYRWFDKRDIDVLFPFGYGLSYTTFDYRAMKIDSGSWPMIVSVELKNTGKVEGAEISQLYISYTGSFVEKPKRELKGFDKIFLKPGESKTVCFKLREHDFAYYNVAKGKWTVEQGDYIIGIGASSRDIVATIPVDLSQMCKNKDKYRIK